MSGTVGLVLGFSLSSVNGCKSSPCPSASASFHVHAGSSPSTLVPLLLGVVSMLLGVVYEMRTQREPLFPKSMFYSQTVGKFIIVIVVFMRNSDATAMCTGIILIISFLHNFAFNAGTFFLALYYQVWSNSLPAFSLY